MPMTAEERARYDAEQAIKRKAAFEEFEQRKRQGANDNRTLAEKYGSVTADELEATDFPQMKWAVPGIIPSGLTILAGAPKIGKSMLALAVANDISLGAPTLGNIELEQGPVIYLALEDTRRRLKKRLRKIRQGDPPNPNLHLVTAWKRFDHGGLEQLHEMIHDVQPRLVIIDTWAKVRRARQKNKPPYEDDYDAITPLKALADETDTAIIVVHHTRKTPQNKDGEKAELDPFEEVSGTTGITGAADGLLLLKRPRTGIKGTLFVGGRDIEDERTYDVLWRPEATRWVIEGAAGPRLTPERGKILAAVKKLTAEKGHATPAEVTKETKLPYDSVKQLLRKMLEDGVVKQPATGQYIPIHSVHSVHSPNLRVNEVYEVNGSVVGAAHA